MLNSEIVALARNFTFPNGSIQVGIDNDNEPVIELRLGSERWVMALDLMPDTANAFSRAQAYAERLQTITDGLKEE